MDFVAPPPLQPGDTVAIVAPAGPFDRASFETGLQVLARRFSPRFDDRLYATHRYLAGSDEVRLSQLQAAIDDPEVKAIVTARGGYGSMRLLPRLRLHRPVWFAGFSDVTALHLALNAGGVQSIHAPVLTQLGTQPPQTIERYFAALERKPLAPLEGTRTVIPGIATGPLLGGNVSVLTRLIGTPYLPSLVGSVLLLEDVGERPYRLDRMWTHLALAGLFHGVRGIVLGEFTGCEEKGQPYSSDEVLDELAGSLGIPCAAGFRIGHGAVNEPVVLGAQVTLDATAKTLS